MSEYHLTIDGVVGLSDYSSISDYISLVSPRDKLIISMEDENKKESDYICDMLDKNKFDIMQRGNDTYGKYYIQAYKKR